MDGNVYVIGYFRDIATFGSFTLTSSGSYDIYVGKIDADDNWLWVVQAGGSSHDFSKGISTDADGNIYVTGFFYGTASFGSFTLTSSGYEDVFIAKLDTNGNWLWAEKAGGSNWDQGFGISTDTVGNVYIIGWFIDIATFGSFTLTSSGVNDIFVAKMDTNGNWLWVEKAGASDIDIGYGISNDSDGNSFVTGNFHGTASFGSFTLTSSGYEDIFVAKLDTNGNWLWAEKAGGSDVNADVGRGISTDTDGNVYVTGDFRGMANFGSFTLTSSGWNDIFVAKLDNNGNWLWVVKAGGSGNNDYGDGISTDEDGNIYVAGCFTDIATFGSFTLTSSGDADVFVTKLDADGNWLWVTQACGDSYIRVKGISTSAEGNVYISGYFQSTIIFGSFIFYNNGRDIFIAKLGRGLIANFYANPNTGYLPLTVNFTDLSSPQDSIVSWQWDFQNDNEYYSFEQNPTFTYTDAGIYSVKLKVSDGTNIDSLIQYNYITVEYVPPAAPTNVQVNIIYPDAIITWTAVDTTIFGDPITPDGYIILYNETPYEEEQFYYFLDYTFDLTYTHTFVAQHREQMFYKVVAYVDFGSEQIEYLLYLKNSQERVKWSNVKWNLKH